MRGTWKVTGPGRGTWKTDGETSGWLAALGGVAAAVAVAYIGSAVIRAAWRSRVELAAIYGAGIVVLVLMVAAAFGLYALLHRPQRARRQAALPAAAPQRAALPAAAPAELPAARAAARALPPAAPSAGGGTRILGGYDEDTWRKMLVGREGLVLGGQLIRVRPEEDR
jgi:hypothetical protein